jgi:(p)ppGpp synthase/HD superfamily hydrolase
MASLDRALALAVHIHRGLKDKSGRPYILHPLRVMMKMNTDEEMIVAVLHDVIEDSDMTIYDLLKEDFPPAIISAVDAISRRSGESYNEYILRVQKNPLAVRVKLADLEDNMDLNRLPEVGIKDLDRHARYQKAYAILSGRSR